MCSCLSMWQMVASRFRSKKKPKSVETRAEKRGKDFHPVIVNKPLTENRVSRIVKKEENLSFKRHLPKKKFLTFITVFAQ